METPAGPVFAVDRAWPNVLPGPFILLIILPALPLLLFSIGARPPDTHSLPFSTDDLWQTTALVTVAGAVVLCVGLYPGLLADIGAWVKSGHEGGSPFWAAFTDPVRNLAPASKGTHLAPAQPQIPQQHMRVRYQPGPKQPPRVETRPEAYRRDWRGSVYYRPASRRVVSRESPGGRLAVELIDVPLQAKDPGALSARHLAALRDSPMSDWFSSAQPPLSLGLLSCALTVGIVVIIVGKILHSAYDADRFPTARPSKSEAAESWHMRELQKRVKETKAETSERIKKAKAEFVGRLNRLDYKSRAEEMDKRQKELQALTKELKKRNLPLIGLDWDLGGAQKRDTVKGAKPDSKKSVDADPAAKPNRLRSLLLGPLAKPSQAAPTPRTISDVPITGGPGWTPADDAVAHAAIRGGAARAEDMANRLVKEKV